MSNTVLQLARLTCRCLLFLTGVFGFVESHAQSSRVPLLERTISITINQERLDAALKRISNQGGFTFSYSPAIIETDKIVSYSFVNKTVREILDQIFKGTVQYKERNKYIILTRAEVSTSAKTPKVLSGYVIDESTGTRLKNVSIYDPVTLSSAVTDAYGYFQIEIDNPTGEEVRLAVNKLNYTDTLVVVPTDDQRLLNIPIRFNTEKIATLADSVGKKIKRFWLSAKKTTKQAINIQNIRDTLHRRTQVSLVPFIGTNGKLSGNVINDYSFNIYGGYSKGVRKFELGGLFNIEGGDVSGVQIAGLFNSVWGKRDGFQMAGLFNLDRDSARGAQVAGMINLNLNGSPPFALAGLLNVTRRDAGTAIAGLANVTVGQQKGANVAGLFNVATKDARPAQIAGLFNFTAGNMRGAQVAGLFNIAGKEVTGAQVSGLVNFAPRVRGAQVGFINIADSITGVPIGFLSFVAKGYHKIEISADEIFYTNLAFRTGVRQFYNIFTAGVKPSTLGQDGTYWTFGYGIGTAPRLNQWLSLNFDLTANQVVQSNIEDGINMLNKLYLGVDMKVSRYFSITAGATLNGYVTDTTYEYPDLFTEYKPHLVHDRTYSNDINLKMWWGGKIGLRFL